jgi:hypothetical protein
VHRGGVARIFNSQELDEIVRLTQQSIEKVREPIRVFKTVKRQEPLLGALFFLPLANN